MPRPGLSTDTFPAINDLIRAQANFQRAVENLSRSPAAEHVTQVACASAHIISCAIEVIDSFSLDSVKIMQTYSKGQSPAEAFAEVKQMVTSKEEQ